MQPTSRTLVRDFYIVALLMLSAIEHNGKMSLTFNRALLMWEESFFVVRLREKKLLLVRKTLRAIIVDAKRKEFTALTTIYIYLQRTGVK
jgi:tmRNA-binding protein